MPTTTVLLVGLDILRVDIRQIYDNHRFDVAKFNPKRNYSFVAAKLQVYLPKDKLLLAILVLLPRLQLCDCTNLVHISQ